MVAEYLTLDGVMEAPGTEPGHPHGGWTLGFDDPARERFELEETLATETLLLGATTYEEFADFWPTQDGPLADKLNAMPKLVASQTLATVDWTNSKLIDHDVPAAVAEAKQGEGGTILVAGSRTLVHTLMRHDLVDEFQLLIFPLVLGSGLRLFPETIDCRRLHLADTRRFDSGVVVNTYTPNGR
jgi:dihydrofolate reductase